MWKPLVLAIALFAAACTSSPAATTTTSVASSSSTTSTTAEDTTTSTVSPAATTPTTSSTTTAAPQTTAAPPTTATTTTITAPPGNRPPAVEIIAPEHLSAHTAAFNLGDFGAFIKLSSSASDPDGDEVTVTWSSSATGPLGTGGTITPWISTQGSDAAQPVITAIATDQWGAFSTASVQIIVWIPSDS